MNYPDWWPNGCDEALVRDCNCQHCKGMIERLERHREEQSEDGEHAPLTAFQ